MPSGKSTTFCMRGMMAAERVLAACQLMPPMIAWRPADVLAAVIESEVAFDGSRGTRRLLRPASATMVLSWLATKDDVMMMGAKDGLVTLRKSIWIGSGGCGLGEGGGGRGLQEATDEDTFYVHCGGAVSTVFLAYVCLMCMDQIK